MFPLPLLVLKSLFSLLKPWLFQDLSLCQIFLLLLFTPKYPKDDFQQIVKMVFKTQSSVIIAIPIKSAKARLLKTRFPDVYKNKNYFAIVKVKNLNYIPFAISFLRNQAFSYQQQYQHKFKDKITISIILNKFKIFLHYNLIKFQTFIDSIQKKFWKNARRSNRLSYILRVFTSDLQKIRFCRRS